jgi:hypothetical protein
MRDILPYVQQQLGMEVTLLFPQELGKSILSLPSKGVCNECFLSHSSSLQPCLSTCLENASQQFPYREQIQFLVFFKTREFHMLSLLRNGHQTHSSSILLSSTHEFPTFSCLLKQDFMDPNPNFVGQVKEFPNGYYAHFLIDSRGRLPNYHLD